MNTSTEIAQLKKAMGQCRAETLRVMALIPPDFFCQQIHPEFSPIGWHFGHIGFTEALWLLPPSQQSALNHPDYPILFRADGLPKNQRCHLPDQSVIQTYLDQIRAAVWESLENHQTPMQSRLWWWLLQHESQHGETIAFLCHLAGIPMGRTQLTISPNPRPFDADMIEIPAGGFWQGSDDILAQDNERPAHWVELDTYWLDRYPITQGQYQDFITQGGYEKSQYWTAAGWEWKQKNQIAQPLYWTTSSPNANHNNNPVYGVSAYEAEAYAKFVGKRLPTEAEWEKAAHLSLLNKEFGKTQSLNTLDATHYNYNAEFGQTTPVNFYTSTRDCQTCEDLLGNIWEWTASTFAPYEYFQPYPYRGYSQDYFDGNHRVLRGGSWATRSWGLRPSFRNWYHPWTRQILAGFRCARNK